MNQPAISARATAPLALTISRKDARKLRFDCNNLRILVS
jgi:hypothetical protein